MTPFGPNFRPIKPPPPPKSPPKKTGGGGGTSTGKTSGGTTTTGGETITGGGGGGAGGSTGGGGGTAAGGGTTTQKGGTTGGTKTTRMLTLPPPPAWWHGINTPTNVAATIRDGWFAFLGDLSGFPYASGGQYAAYVQPLLDFEDLVPNYPFDMTITIIDANGKQVGQTTVSVGQPNPPAIVPGVYAPTQTYSLTFELTIPGGVPVSSTLSGIQGSQFLNPSSYFAPQIDVSIYPAQFSAGIQVNNADGTPAVGYYCQIWLYQLASANTEPTVLASEAGTTDANGKVAWNDVGTDLSASGEYEFEVAVYEGGGPPAGDTTILAETTTSALTGSQVFSGTYTDTLTLPAGGATINGGRATVTVNRSNGMVCAAAEISLVVTDQTGKEIASLSHQANGVGVWQFTVGGIPSTSTTLSFAAKATWRGFTGSKTDKIEAAGFEKDGITVGVQC